MSFLFGGNSSNNSSNGTGAFNKTDNINSTTNNTGTTNTSGTTQAINPDWVTNLAQQLGGGVSSLSATNPSSYVAGVNPLQTQAATGASWLGSDPGAWINAGNMIENSGQTGAVTRLGQTGPASATASLGSQYMDAYKNPYTDQVVNAALNDFDNSAGQTRASQALDLARSGAFGGSGAAITQSQTEGQLARARASTDAGLRDQAFNTAAGLGMQDAGRVTDTSVANANLAQQNKGMNIQAILSGLQQQGAAGQALAGLTSGQDANARANIGAQDAAGGTLRDINQQQLAAPLTMQQYLTQLFSGLPLGLFNGQQQTGVSNTTGTSNTAATDNSSGTETQNTNGKTSGFNFGYSNKGG